MELGRHRKYRARGLDIYYAWEAEVERYDRKIVKGGHEIYYIGDAVVIKPVASRAPEAPSASA